VTEEVRGRWIQPCPAAIPYTFVIPLFFYFCHSERSFIIRLRMMKMQPRAQALGRTEFMTKPEGAKDTWRIPSPN
jgi:hypothetical protein